MPDLSVFEPDVQSGNFSVNGSPFEGYDLAVSPPAYGSEGKTPGGFAGTSPTEPANDFAVRDQTDLGIKINPTGLTDPNTPTITAAPNAPFDYSKLSGGEPELMPPTEKFSTPYYAARTNDGDLAGAVMVAEGQKVRMVDRKTGDVVFEGAGPEGAKQATALANAMSQDKGRKAAWAIEADNGQGGYTVQAAERYDPKKPGLFGKLLPIAAAVLGTILLPGIGTAIGLGGLTTAAGGATALGAGLGAATGTAALGVARGDPLKDILVNSAISGLGAGVVGPAVSKFATGLPGAANGLSPASGVNGIAANALPGSVALINTPQTLANGIAGIGGGVGGGALGAAAGNAGGNTVSELLVTGARNAGVGALASAGGAGVAALAPDLISGSSGNDVLRGDPADDMKGQGDNTIEEVVVTAQQLQARGVPLDGLYDALLKLGISGTVAFTAVQALGGAAPSPNALNPAPGNVPGLTPTNVPGPPVSLTTALQNGPAAVGQWIAANPLQAAQLGLTAAGIAGAVFGGNGGGNNTFSGGVGPNGSAGTPGSLDPIFRAQLPTSRFAVPRQQNDMSGVNFARYGQGPQQNFFKPPGMRRGGEFAVKGRGGGRSDQVPALLSDGEYVLDAETIALLGDGSSKDGADIMDQFRINVRKHKGKSLATGKFSVNAKRPEAYLKGAR